MGIDRSVACLLAAAFNAALAAFLWWRYKQNRLHRVFALMVGGSAAYALFLAGLAGAGNADDARAWVRVGTVLPYVFLFSFHRFAMVFSRAEAARWPRRLAIACAVPAGADVVLRLSGLVPARMVEVPGQGWFPDQDALYLAAYVPVMLALVCSSLWALARRMRAASSPMERRQLAYVFLAIGGAALISMANLHPALAFLAAFSPAAFSGILAYGITRDRLLDLRLLLRQGALGALLSAVLAFLLAMALLLSREAWSSQGGGFDAYGLLGAAALFTLLYEPLRRLSARLLDRIFDLGHFDIGSRLLGYAQLSGRHPRLEDYLGAVCDRLREDHDLEKAVILLVDRHGELLPFASVPRQALEVVDAVPAASPVVERVAREVLGLDLDELSWVRRYEKGPRPADHGDGDAAAGDYLAACRAQAAFALRSGDGRAVGLLLLGPPTNGRSLSRIERELMAALAPQLAVVVDNALLQGQVRHADRLHSLGTLAAGLAHELRNPLSSILVFVQMLPERFHDGQFREKFSRIVQQELDKLNRLTEQLLQISRPTTQALDHLDLQAQVERVEQLLRYQFRRKEVRLELELAPACWVRASADELGQILINLLINALAVSGPGRTVRVRSEAHEGSVSLKVQDQGGGIPEGDLHRVFEPFFTTKPDGNGLGLATSLRIAESFGGTLRARNRPEGGAEFELRLPLQAAPQAALHEASHGTAGR